MNKWQECFARKVDSARQVSTDRFQQMADETLEPVFGEFQQFMSQQGFESTAPVTKKGLRTYKFAASENAYVLVTFRMVGVEYCETHTDFFVPQHQKSKPQIERIELSALDSTGARGVFERALDAFMDTYLESIEEDEAPRDEPVAVASD
ncbi:MAG: hypothetical protein ACYTFA_06865 [Planctomycetota bacterium]|jgi:hypothetical protein